MHCVTNWPGQRFHDGPRHRDRRRPGAQTLLATLVLAIGATAQAAGAETTPPLPAGDAQALGFAAPPLAQVRAAMQESVDRSEQAGVVLLLARNGRVAFHEAAGLRDREAGEPMPVDGIFSLASMTKVVVVLAALAMHDAGAFSLDAPIADRMPRWRSPVVVESTRDPQAGADVVRQVPARTPITPRHLMSHSSGLYYATAAPPGVDPKSVPAASPLVATSMDLKAFVDALASTPLKFHPGEGYEYGTSIDVLARYLEVVSGKPLEALLREQLFVPLRMHDTGFSIPPEKHARIAQLYTQPAPGTLQRGRDMRLVPRVQIGGYGLYSTAMDFARLCQMLLNGGELDGVRVLRPATVDEVFRNQLAPQVGRRFGLGGSVDGAGLYAFGGADGTQFWIDRGNAMIGVYMAPTSWYRTPRFAQVRGLVREALAGGTPAP
jgi:CubicO group peptidase (beta-lactamase class C family)